MSISSAKPLQHPLPFMKATFSYFNSVSRLPKYNQISMCDVSVEVLDKNSCFLITPVPAKLTEAFADIGMLPSFVGSMIHDAHCGHSCCEWLHEVNFGEWRALYPNRRYLEINLSSKNAQSILLDHFLHHQNHKCRKREPYPHTSKTLYEHYETSTKVCTGQGAWKAAHWGATGSNQGLGSR